MNNYRLPNFTYPVYSVNFDPKSQQLYSQSRIFHPDFFEKQLSENEFVILDFNRDHANFTLGPTTVIDAYHHFQSKGYHNIIYLTSEKLDIENVYFFPNWLYCKSTDYSEINIVLTNKRNHLLSCLNRFPSPHRIYFYYKFLHKSYYNDCLTSFLGLVNPYNNYVEIGEFNPIYSSVPNYVKDFYEKTKFQKKLESDHIPWPNDHNPNHAAYADSYMNVITESTYYYSFFTEKTAKSLASEQLFMLIGGSKSILNLKFLGFEIFDSINNSYDLIEDMIERVDHVVDIIDSIYYNIEDLFWQYSKERIYNREYFLSNDFRNKCLDPIKHLLK